MVTDKVERGELALDRFVLSGELTDHGRAAFIAATDPFHDKPIDGLRGWPDLETAPSVIRIVKKSVTVNTADTHSPASTVHIYTYPVLDTSILHRAVRRNGVIDSIATGVGNDSICAPCVINIYDSTNADNMGQDNWTSQFVLSIPDNYLTSPTRLIGMGVEVHNVTAELYKNGTCTVYQTPQSQDYLSTFTFRPMTVDGIAYVSTVEDGRVFQPFASNISEAMLYEGSRQWEAAEGAYCVVPFTSKDNIARAPEYQMPVVRGTSTSTEVAGALNTSTLFTGPYASGSIAGDNFIFLPHIFTPTHSKGIILSGLGEQTVLTINVNYFLETFPMTADDPLVTLAHPSAAFDPMALEMISQTAQNIPVGVPVSENGLGDFFLEVVETIAPILGGVASAFFPEFAPIIGTVAGGAGKLASAAKTKKAEKRETKKGGAKAGLAEKQAKARTVAAAKTKARMPPNTQRTAPSAGKPKKGAARKQAAANRQKAKATGGK